MEANRLRLTQIKGRDWTTRPGQNKDRDVGPMTETSRNSLDRQPRKTRSRWWSRRTCPDPRSRRADI